MRAVDRSHLHVLPKPRLQLEAESVEAEFRNKIERNDQEMLLRRKPSGMEVQLELEAQREVIELAEMMRKEKLFVKLKKMEMMDRTYSKIMYLSSVNRYATKISKQVHASIHQTLNFLSGKQSHWLPTLVTDDTHTDMLMLKSSNQLGKLHLLNLPMWNKRGFCSSNQMCSCLAIPLLVVPKLQHQNNCLYCRPRRCQWNC